MFKISLFFLLLAGQLVTAQNTAIKKQVYNYDSSIKAISIKFQDLMVGEELLKNKLFISIFENDHLYLEDAITFLSNPSNDHHEKSIAIYSMQNLPLSDYLVLCKKGLIMTENKSISEELFKRIITPNFLHKYPIIKNYKNKEVIALLKRIEVSSLISDDFKKMLDIPQILSGKRWKEIQEYLKNQK